MQRVGVIVSLAGVAGVHARDTSPVSKVLNLLTDLQAKINSEGEAAKKAYDELTEWCEDGAKNMAFEIKTAKSEIEELQATIAEQTSHAASLSAKVEELGGSITADDADLKSATKIRSDEAAEFKATEKELIETISTLERAVGILEREMHRGGASAMQLKNAGSLAAGLSALVQASVLSSADASKLTALVQNAQDAADSADDAELGAPAAAVYEGHSNNIIDTLEDLHEKAEAELADARKRESNALHSFRMLEQNLKDQMKFNKKDMDEAKKAMAASGEKKAAAEGDLAVTTKDLAQNEKTLRDTKQDCMTRSQDYEAATKSRKEELEALAAAKSAIAENTGASASLTYDGAASFLQETRSNLLSHTDLINFEAVRLVRDLARKQHAPELAQLASRMASAMRMHANAADPFEKVRGLISDMIARLENDAQGDASHKAYCDKELASSRSKKGELDTTIDKLTTKIDSMTARSAQLKEETAQLQKSLADLAHTRAEATKIRQEEKATFTKNKADMQQGLEGVKLALKILRDYYSQQGAAHAAADGAGSGIVGLLEVVESDFSKGLAEMMASEENAAESFKQSERENEVLKATREQDVKYKAKEATELDKAVAETSADRSGAKAEVSAVAEYLAKLDEMCVAKPETYEARSARREAEIAGLREALKILEGEAVLLQRKSSLRGVKPHH
eukprot:TRINITY_DN12284_c1_g1_i1.p1 TRINITY_DN12284_c1_g1~~TRINITY_DN12284_c1_g1_i1.p1  ORF type:complete len:685 (-),score=243.30 TRINITY_DN12284_c1_g1_i1:249-2303(-)